jgi:hypothetical protein
MRVAVKGARCRSDECCALEATASDGLCDYHRRGKLPDLAGMIRLATPLEKENGDLKDEVRSLKIKCAEYSRWLTEEEERNLVLAQENEVAKHNAFHFENNFRAAQKLIAELNAKVKEMEEEIEVLRNASLVNLKK